MNKDEQKNDSAGDAAAVIGLGGVMSPVSTGEDSLLCTLPPCLRRKLQAELSPETVQTLARHDLDANGMYVDGYLILTGTRLGHFQRRGVTWESHWLDIEELTGTSIVEGLRMSLLTLLAHERVVAEYRFSLRHAQSVSKLYRRLERQIDGKGARHAIPKGMEPGPTRNRCDRCQHVIPAGSDVCLRCLCRRKTLSRLMGFIRPYRWSVLAGLIFALLATAAGLARPYMTKPLINQGLGAYPGSDPDYGTLLTYVLILAGLTLVAATSGAIRQHIMASLGSRVARDIRDATYDHLHTLSLSFFSRKPVGSLVTRITSDSDRIWDFIAFTIMEVAIALLTIAGVGAALFVMNWRLASFVLVPIPIMAVIVFLSHRRLRRCFHHKFHRWSQLTSIVSDAVPGAQVIKAFGQEKREVLRFAKKNREVCESELALTRVHTVFDPAVQICGQIGLLIVWALGGYWAVNGKLDVGTLMAFITYMWMFYGPIQMLSHMDRRISQAATSMQRISEILDTEPTIVSRIHARPPNEIAGRIELLNVSFSYDGIRKVLKNVNLCIMPGETIGLVGPSGGGKSTLANLICRFYDVIEGQILVDGVNVKDYDIESLRRRIGFVLQEPFLFQGTVAENIAYGKPDATIDEIITAARTAHAHDFIVGFPDGYETLVGEQGHTLSGGERQRISVARAILNNPSILIFDEATSSVDPEAERRIQESLDKSMANRTTIVIAHRPSTLRRADRLVIVDKGEIVEQRSHREPVPGLLQECRSPCGPKKDGFHAELLHRQTD